VGRSGVAVIRAGVIEGAVRTVDVKVADAAGREVGDGEGVGVLVRVCHGVGLW
jgi:hypothetical protein